MLKRHPKFLHILPNSAARMVTWEQLRYDFQFKLHSLLPVERKHLERLR